MSSAAFEGDAAASERDAVPGERDVPNPERDAVPDDRDNRDAPNSERDDPIEDPKTDRVPDPLTPTEGYPAGVLETDSAMASVIRAATSGSDRLVPGVTAVVRVLVCDDQRELRRALATVIGTIDEYELVGEAEDGDSCMAQLRGLRPDVLILDVNMPKGGPQLVREAKELLPKLKIVVFSVRGDEKTMSDMYAAGVDDYVVKTGRVRPLRDSLLTFARTSTQ